MATPLLTDGTCPIIPSVSLEALLARRDAAVAQLATIAGSVAEYQEIASAIWPPAQGEEREGRWRSAPYTFREPIDLRPGSGGAYLTDTRWLEASTKAIDAAIWDHLLDESGLRTFLDAKARKDWSEQIEKRECPPLTAENIAATFQGLHAQRGELFERGVIGVARALSWDYRTNLPTGFGKRLILRHVVSGDGYPNTYGHADALDDLDRALHVLDGKPEPDHRQSVSKRLWSRQPRHAPVESPYLVVKTFKNGNGHVAFKRPDLVDELNRILARHYPDRLPPAREA